MNKSDRELRSHKRSKSASSLESATSEKNRVKSASCEKSAASAKQCKNSASLSAHLATTDPILGEVRISEPITPILQEANMPDETQKHSKKITLPDFDENDAELWFEMCDAIFKRHGVEDDEGRKFASILEKIDTKNAKHIRGIILSTDDAIVKTAYTKAREQMINCIGDSREKKLDKLLCAADIPHDAKPSAILDILRSRAGDIKCDDVIKRIWFNKLPPSVALNIAGTLELPIETLCKTADSMFEFITKYPPGSMPAVHAVAVQQPNPTTTHSTNSINNPNIDALTTALQELVHRVTALQTENKFIKEEIETIRRSRFRNRSPTPEQQELRGKRGRSNHAYRERSKSRPRLYNGMCWYHFTFGDEARKCEGDCKLGQSKTKSGNEG